jgi:hypothetical protein
MRSWTPRRPSPALEERLFAPEASVGTSRSPDRARLPGWGWLAPVACVFVLALQIAAPDAAKRLANHRPTSLPPGSESRDGQLLAAYSPAWANSAMNNVNGETFESTNWTTAPSPMRTLPVFLTLTNGLIQ